MADPWLEGLQLDQLKIYEEGKLNETLYRVIKDNIRFPESSLGDMKSQMAACRLAARRMDELFDKYGRDTILAAIAQIFDETEQKCRNVVAELPDGVYEAQASIDDDGVLRDEEVPIHVKITIKGSDMTIDLSGCSAERKAAINSRTYAGARVAYKALTGPLDPVNEGSFRALKVIIPEGNIMMAGFRRRCRAGAPSCRPWWTPSCRRWPKAMPDRVPAGHHGLLGGSVVFFGAASQDQAALRRAEHRRRRLGRPAVRGRRVRHRLGVPGRRAQRLDRGHRAEVPGGGREPRAAHRFLRRRKISRRARARQQVRNLVEGKWNFERSRRSKCPPWGIAGGTPGEPGGNLLKLPGEKSFKWISGANIPVPLGARGDRAHRRRRRLGRSLAAPCRTGRGGCRRGADFAARRRASSTAWCSGATCRSTKPRPSGCATG